MLRVPSNHKAGKEFEGGISDHEGGAYTSIFNVAPIRRESDEKGKKKKINSKIFENNFIEKICRDCKDIIKYCPYLRERYSANECGVNELCALLCRLANVAEP